ncbi:hypothetical protein ACFLYQ_02895 [Chloroflexota bacterium]
MQQLSVKTRSEIDASVIYAMRRSGATLQQIAVIVGRTRERIRQILVKNYGSANHRLISTEQLYRLSGTSRYRVIELYQDNVITPAREWNTSIGHHLLWHPDTIKQIKGYLTSSKQCKVCNGSVPVPRRVYCSSKCYQEGHKCKQS